MKKKILITGASKGIGKSIAQTLSNGDFELFVTGRDQTRLNETAQKTGAKAIEINLLENNACEKILSQTGPVDILINNAGEYIWAPVEKITDEQISRIFKLNLEIPYKLITLFTKQMKENKWGRIINIGSISGSVGEANASLYSASKSGLIGMSKALALELAEHGITINVINPGWVKTDLIDNPCIDLEEELECIPQKRFIHPDEIAKLTEYLISDEAKGITGQSLNICAGLSLG
ncbi:MAG: SDR family NAD(P)-dependent oxidoreductase [Candidatus Gastranaerophilales bacterium]|nr:SDR family NAD(P)-dependent oxidoreductase [Candidatus Gastranaerophilales bacterium]